MSTPKETTNFGVLRAPGESDIFGRCAEKRMIATARVAAQVVANHPSANPVGEPGWHQARGRPPCIVTRTRPVTVVAERPLDKRSTL